MIPRPTDFSTGEIQYRLNDIDDGEETMVIPIIFIIRGGQRRSPPAGIMALPMMIFMIIGLCHVHIATACCQESA